MGMFVQLAPALLLNNRTAPHAYVKLTANIPTSPCYWPGSLPMAPMPEQVAPHRVSARPADQANGACREPVADCSARCRREWLHIIGLAAAIIAFAFLFATKKNPAQGRVFRSREISIRPSCVSSSPAEPVPTAGTSTSEIEFVSASRTKEPVIWATEGSGGR